MLARVQAQFAVQILVAFSFGLFWFGLLLVRLWFPAVIHGQRRQSVVSHPCGWSLHKSAASYTRQRLTRTAFRSASPPGSTTGGAAFHALVGKLQPINLPSSMARSEQNKFIRMQ
jgi:hypothetical protein